VANAQPALPALASFMFQATDREGGAFLGIDFGGEVGLSRSPTGGWAQDLSAIRKETLNYSQSEKS